MPLWKPTDRSDVRLWLKSEDITGGDWKDSSKHSYSVTSGAKPSLSTTRKNNKKGATFNGSSQYLSIADTGVQPMDVGTGGYFLGLFAKIPNISSGVETFISHDSSGNRYELRMNSSQYLIAALPSGNTTGGDALTVGDYYWLNNYRSGTTVSVGYNDTVDQTETSSSDLDEDSEFNIGCRNENDKFFGSDMLEVLVIHADIGADDIARVAGYISHKFDNESALGSSHAYKSGPPTTCHCIAEGTLSTTALSSNPRNPAELSENLNIFDERR
tara:strand:- start:597 stop:1412 length:816 start_codon:yes stop_codon:yes gene_type:complete